MTCKRVLWLIHGVQTTWLLKRRRLMRGPWRAGKFQAAMAGQGVEMDMDEVECLVANLVFRGHVRGYLSHRHHVAVLSKQDDPAI